VTPGEQPVGKAQRARPELAFHPVVVDGDGVVIGRFKVRRLISELELICKQPGPQAYKQANVERPDIPIRLNREFNVSYPD
tara:strand:+ start:5472 stop:5714 length:243 start_codon:yes stop_codon:yes gene_type:complete